MAQDYSQVNFRIPTKLKEQIEQSAIVNERSITAELVFRLEQTFANTESSNQQIADLAERLDSMDTAYRQTMAHYDRLLKLLEQKVDLQSLLVSKD